MNEYEKQHIYLFQTTLGNLISHTVIAVLILSIPGNQLYKRQESLLQWWEGKT